jgi:hypothetical protein
MRALGFGGLFAVAMALLFSPLGAGLILLMMVYQLGAVVVSLVVDGLDIATDDIAATVQVARIIAGPHPSPVARHGEVVSVALHNSSRFRHTPLDDGDHDAPLYLSCAVGGTLSQDNVRLGQYNRVVAMKLDWIIDADGNPSFPILRPGETRTVDFSTKLDWDFDPIKDHERIGRCLVGGDKYQALMLWGINVADRNRGNTYHYNMTTVTPAGRQLGYTVD